MGKRSLRRLKWPSEEALEFTRTLHLRQSLEEARAGEASVRKSEEVFGEALGPAEAVNRIVDDVRSEGDAALVRYTKLLDGVDITPERFRVGEEEVARALSRTPEEVMRALETARDNIVRYEEELCRRHTGVKVPTAGGGHVEARFVPFGAAGIYVPGGTAPYPSSVLMNALPAVVAGVGRTAVFTPPEPAAGILAACALAGVKEVYRIGGAQAVAAMAYGTESVRGVDIVAGPGNIFVSLAKKRVFGDVAVDLIAGPSEILVIADETAEAGYVAADMLSQAEHDPVSSAVLVTTHAPLADAVCLELDAQIGKLARAHTAAAALRDFGAVMLVPDIATACEAANAVAPEHLEIMTADPESVVPMITKAGAVFVGAWSPEPVGDYTAGPSHTLPTGGRARFSSGLSSLVFLRKMSIIACTEEDIRGDMGAAARTLARAEGLGAHEESIARRTRQVSE
ncbi:MAG: histidinol dehydrogenase [Planctomycetes bacterium]|nr:histidinol dehydrogenase [Planctomycetota bacterium]